MEEAMSAEAMTINVIHKINNKLKFIFWKKVFLTLELRCPLFVMH